MTMTRNAPGRLAVASVIARREAAAAIHGIGGYLALTVALVAATWILLVDVRALAIGGLLVLADPFGPSLTIALMIIALYLAVSAAVSTARDREIGTLEVLFWGPVDEASYILGKIGGLLAAFIAALPLLFAVFVLLSLMTGFALTSKMPVSLVLSIVPAAVTISFGVLLAVGTSRVRTAVLLLVAVIAVLLGINFAYNLILLVPISDAASPVLPLRDTLAALDEIVRWLSPFSYLERVVDAVTRGAWRSAALGLGAALGYAAAVIVLAALWLRRRGVQRSGE
jgi:ABC-type transport system involved in multi-copper enzyme maturation permease subunit